MKIIWRLNTLIVKKAWKFFSQVLHNLSGDVCKNLQLL